MAILLLTFWLRQKMPGEIIKNTNKKILRRLRVSAVRKHEASTIRRYAFSFYAPTNNYNNSWLPQEFNFFSVWAKYMNMCFGAAVVGLYISVLAPPVHSIGLKGLFRVKHVRKTVNWLGVLVKWQTTSSEQHFEIFINVLKFWVKRKLIKLKLLSVSIHYILNSTNKTHWIYF